MPTHVSVGKAAVAEEEPGMCNLPTVVIGGPGIMGKILRANVGKSPLAAGAGSNLQGLLKRDVESK
jgi:hypothetical protein